MKKTPGISEQSSKDMDLLFRGLQEVGEQLDAFFTEIERLLEEYPSPPVRTSATPVQ